MIRRIAALAVVMALAACGGGSYGYMQTNAPPAAVPAPPPPAAYVAPPPAPAQQPAPPPAAVAEPGVAAPPAPRPAPARGDVVVPGTVERQILPPQGDPRSAQERARDIRAWDDCVMRAQGMGESDPMRPQLDAPEDLCRQQLGMASRTAVPSSRRP